MLRPLAFTLLLLATPALAANLAELTGRLDAIAAQGDLLRPGDRATANALVLKVNAVRTELGRLQPRDAAVKAQIDRSLEVINKVREQGLKAPTGEAPPPGAEIAMGSIDRHYFEEYEKIAARYRKDLETTEPIEAIDRISLHGAADVMRSALERVGDTQHPQVLEARAFIERFEDQLAAKVEAGKKARDEKAAAFAAEAKDVGGQLGELAALFDEKTFSCKLERPYSVARVTEWVSNLKQWSLMRQKGSTHLDQLVAEHPAFARDPRLLKLQVWFDKHLGGVLDRCVDAQVSTAPASNGGRAGDFYQLIGLGNRVVELGGKYGGSPKVAIDALLGGAEGAEALATFNEAYLGKKDPESRALARRLRAMIDTVEANAKAAVAATRMPAALSTDGDLLATAAGAILRAGYAPGLRTVINSKLAHVSTTSTDTREQGAYLVVTTYPRVYDEFQVCVAEQQGERYRLVYYTIRKFSRGGSVTPIGRWLVADRIVSSQILAENIGK